MGDFLTFFLAFWGGWDDIYGREGRGRKKMHSIFMKMHLYRRAFELKKKVPKNYKEKLTEVVEEVDSPVKVYLSGIKDAPFSVLNAGAYPCCFSDFILCTAEWAVRIVFFDSAETRNSFRITVGHELTHLDGDFSKKHYHRENWKFLSWVNEVHADFGGAQKMVGGSRELAVSGIRYKQKLKKKDHDGSYPSWEKRAHYVEKYNFSIELLEIIAEQTGCTNRKLIEQVHEYYGDIVLH